MKHIIHIVCHDVPYPVDHGGYFDLYYKIKALHAAQVGIHLHCFEYGRGMQPHLNEFCLSVSYYERRSDWSAFKWGWPYIVSSRISTSLANRLLQDDFPILLEGVHVTSIVWDSRFADRKITVRLHNVEYVYYKQLFRTEQHFFRKCYYLLESFLLKRYEKKLAHRTRFLSVSYADANIYKIELGAQQIQTVPVFLPFEKVESEAGVGYYCLYHGNLSVPENEKAAFWLLKEVFNDLKIPLVIAGKDPSEKLEAKAHEQQHTCLVANPSWKEMQDMIGKAQIHLVPSFNATGIKLKLINVLFNGKHCIANPAAIEGSGLESLCYSASNAAAMKSLILQLYRQYFSEEEVLLRKKILGEIFNATAQTKLLIEIIC